MKVIAFIMLEINILFSISNFNSSMGNYKVFSDTPFKILYKVKKVLPELEGLN